VLQIFFSNAFGGLKEVRENFVYSWQNPNISLPQMLQLVLAWREFSVPLQTTLWSQIGPLIINLKKLKTWNKKRLSINVLLNPFQKLFPFVQLSPLKTHFLLSSKAIIFSSNWTTSWWRHLWTPPYLSRIVCCFRVHDRSSLESEHPNWLSKY